MSATPEESALTPDDIWSTYNELVGLWSQIDGLQEQIASLSGQAQEKMSGLSSRVRESGLPDDESKFMVAALFRGAETEEERYANMAALIDIDKRIKASRGQAVLWLSSKTIQHAGWSSHGESDEVKESVHIGILAQDAVLQVGEYGKLTAPLIQVAGAEIIRRASREIYEPDYPLQGARIPYYRNRVIIRNETELTIEAKDLSKPDLCIGDDEVDAAIAQADDEFRPYFADLRDRVTVTLF